MTRLHTGFHVANTLKANRSLGGRMADRFCGAFGTWTYIAIQTAIIAAWMTLNVIGFIAHWDPYPFILLNLMFSAQASYAAPLILMAQNRSAEHDRLTAENAYQVTLSLANILDELKVTSPCRLSAQFDAWIQARFAEDSGG